MLLGELDKLTNPNISQEITKLRERVRNLKIEHLPPKLANQKSELQQLINQSKNKLGELQSLLDIFLDNQIEVVQNPENDFARKQTGKLKGLLRAKLTDAEIKNLQDKQAEIIQLQEQLTS
ncbi:1454_t:CDS:1 [Ambispora leptoticha]|uniref:1454_t:CDS:1 n=1 Tax=Ambispora leptoticha TaxID=144679 RepID=A0A9N9EL63_9GLOM|nr:1454_t:CDS:1 [Ambispora leptoticha]